MQKETRLHFTKEDAPLVPKKSKQAKGKAVKKKSPEKVVQSVKKLPLQTISGSIHHQINTVEEDNVGVESAHKTEQAGEGSLRLMQGASRSMKTRLHKTARLTQKTEMSNVTALHRKFPEETPTFTTNPLSRLQQKRAIKKAYAKKRTEQLKKGAKGAAKSTEKGVKTATKTTVEVLKKIVAFLIANPKVLLIIGIILIIVVLLLSCFSSCSLMFQSGASAIAATTYPSEDEDMLAAEEAYLGKEADLQDELNRYAELHPGYDEYKYELDTIGHNPYVLISFLTAMNQKFLIGEVQDTLTMLFEKQYVLTEEVKTEIRYREEVPYEYKICTVHLENRDLSHLPAEIMNEEQLGFYAAYMKTLGNRPDLFPTEEYPNAKTPEPYTDYEIPPEALDDATFAAMIREAEKYLGYPYVWGGASPSTSFDCSGFVSWVINHSGWNVGRRTAQGLLDISTPVSPSNVKPGDLIFFVGTYNTSGASHVGIYVGNGMMIHCGDPISYANINTAYWQEHFYCFGRLPGN